jgi:hypothetical protein
MPLCTGSLQCLTPRWCRNTPTLRLLQAAYDGSYLAKQLDIGTGAALATDTGAAKTIGRALFGAARVFTDKVQSVSNMVSSIVGASCACLQA